MAITSVGIIGLGNFGHFLASLLPEGVRIMGYDIDPSKRHSDIENVDFQTVVTADIVVLAVPLKAYEPTLTKLQDVLPSQSLLVDLCSVKVNPDKLIAKLLPGHQNILSIHPLFGPRSVRNGQKNLEVVVTRASGKRAEAVLNYLASTLKVRLLEMTPQVHDKALADMHAITFFLARGLGCLPEPKQPFDIPSYQMVRSLVAFDSTHSEDLFRTIEVGNPYAAEARAALLKRLTDIDRELTSDQVS